MRSQSAQDDRAKMPRRHVLRANLDHARPAILAVRQQDAEIEVVGKNHPAVFARPLHDLGVRRVVGTDD